MFIVTLLARCAKAKERFGAIFKYGALLSRRSWEL
jgi:hypothetical protein